MVYVLQGYVSLFVLCVPTYILYKVRNISKRMSLFDNPRTYKCWIFFEKIFFSNLFYYRRIFFLYTQRNLNNIRVSSLIQTIFYVLTLFFRKWLPRAHINGKTLFCTSSFL